ncbi:MAG: c-type cytochrome [Bryobacteraceae bacterium]
MLFRDRSSKRVFPTLAASFAALCCAVPAAAQHGKPTPEQLGAIERGKSQFKSSCGFCHGEDATGNRAPDLVRSSIVNHDQDGNLLGPVIRNGRNDKGMPGFPTLKESEVADIVVFLHARAGQAAHSASVPSDYPVAKLLTGNVDEGKAYFNGAGGCTGCHSVKGDLAHVASKYSPIDLQQHIVYPTGRPRRTAMVTLPDGSNFEGRIVQDDEFTIGIVAQDGWYRSWPRASVKVEVHDPLLAHHELTTKYTNADLHNLFAYLVTFK